MCLQYTRSLQRRIRQLFEQSVGLTVALIAMRRIVHFPLTSIADLLSLSEAEIGEMNRFRKFVLEFDASENPHIHCVLSEVLRFVYSEIPRLLITKLRPWTDASRCWRWLNWKNYEWDTRYSCLPSP